MYNIFPRFRIPKSQNFPMIGRVGYIEPELADSLKDCGNMFADNGGLYRIVVDDKTKVFYFTFAKGEFKNEQ